MDNKVGKELIALMSQWILFNALLVEWACIKIVWHKKLEDFISCYA